MIQRGTVELYFSIRTYRISYAGYQSTDTVFIAYIAFEMGRILLYEYVLYYCMCNKSIMSITDIIPYLQYRKCILILLFKYSIIIGPVLHCSVLYDTVQ